jgi:hypothetical protein
MLTLKFFQHTVAEAVGRHENPASMDDHLVAGIEVSGR